MALQHRSLATAQEGQAGGWTSGKMSEKKLTPKQQRFVDQYLIDVNAKQAAIRAGYSAKTAEVQGCRLLRKVQVQQSIQKGQEALSERTLVAQDDVVRGLLKEAEYMDEGSSHSARVSAWAHLGKHLGIFTDNLNLGGEVTVTHEQALEQLE